MNEAQQIFLDHLAQTSPFPFLLHIERAEGLYLYSPDGRRYADLISGIGVSNLGHGHPHVVDAIHRQVDRHLHVMVFGEYIQSASNALAKKLTKVLPPNLNCTFLTNSGTEANEGALKLAKRYTGRHKIVSCLKSYHGSTHGSLSVSGNEIKKNAFRPLLPGIDFMTFNDVDTLKLITKETAGVIVETIQGDAGVRIPSVQYMKALRKRCNDTGALLILDEIQTGMGRTGKLFAFEHFGIVPDILTVGKAFGGGLPIGAFTSSKQIMETLTHNPMLGHITTFGGNPVCCASAGAVLDVLTPALLSSVEEKGALLQSFISHPHIKEIRRMGLMFAVDFDSAERVNRIVNLAKDMGVICYWFLSHPYSFRLAPPLTIAHEEIKNCGEIIRQAIEQS